MKRLAPRALTCLSLFALAGCADFGDSLRAPVAPYTPQNYVGVPAIPAEVRRVVLLPAAGAQVAPAESTAELDPVFLASLQRQQRFEIVPINRAECRRRFGAEELRSTDVLPAGFLNRLASEFGADAVLFLDITAFHAYRPLEIGLRAKLVTLKSREVLWNYDEVFSLANPAIESGARASARRTPAPAPGSRSTNIAQSPSAFAAYVADTAFGTLPPR